MGYFIEVEYRGSKYFVGWPVAHEERYGDKVFAWQSWPGGRWSNCRFNGRLMNPIAFKLTRRLDRALKKMKKL